VNFDFRCGPTDGVLDNELAVDRDWFDCFLEERENGFKNPDDCFLKERELGLEETDCLLEERENGFKNPDDCFLKERELGLEETDDCLDNLLEERSPYCLGFCFSIQDNVASARFLDSDGIRRGFRDFFTPPETTPRSPGFCFFFLNRSIIIRCYCRQTKKPQGW